MTRSIARPLCDSWASCPSTLLCFKKSRNIITKKHYKASSRYVWSRCDQKSSFTSEHWRSTSPGGMTEKTTIAGGSAQKKFKGAWPPSFLFISADIRYAGGGCRILFRNGHWHGSPKNITSWSWKNHLYGAKKTHTDIVWKYHNYHHLVHSSLYISSNFCLKIQNSVCGLQSQRNGPQ